MANLTQGMVKLESVNTPPMARKINHPWSHGGRPSWLALGGNQHDLGLND